MSSRLELHLQLSGMNACSHPQSNLEQTTRRRRLPQLSSNQFGSGMGIGQSSLPGLMVAVAWNTGSLATAIRLPIPT